MSTTWHDLPGACALPAPLRPACQLCPTLCPVITQEGILKPRYGSVRVCSACSPSSNAPLAHQMVGSRQQRALGLSCVLLQPFPSASDEFVLILSEGRKPWLLSLLHPSEVVPLTFLSASPRVFSPGPVKKSSTAASTDTSTARTQGEAGLRCFRGPVTRAHRATLIGRRRRQQGGLAESQSSGKPTCLSRHADLLHSPWVFVVLRFPRRHSDPGLAAQSLTRCHSLILVLKLQSQ